MRKRRNKRKNFSPLQRARYHVDRNNHPTKYGNQRDDMKDIYSTGFVDAICKIDRRPGVKKELGAKKARSYNLGHVAGTRCRRTYLKRTGKEIAYQL